MNKKREKPAVEHKPEADRTPSQEGKKPYKRPVLFVIGKIGQIVSKN